MDFGFSEQQRDVQQLARKILGEQVSADSLAAYDDGSTARFSPALWRQLLTAGLPSVAVDSEYGGSGLGFTELALLVEEVGRSIAPLPVIPHCVGGMLPLQRFGSTEQRERWLAPAARGECLLTAALCEPLNEDPASPRTLSAQISADTVILTGTKSAVPYAAQADRILLSARHSGGVVLLLLDPGATGVSLESLAVSSGEPQCHLTLEDVRVPGADVLVQQGGAGAMRWLAQRHAAAQCAHQVGVVDAALRLAATYTSQREQFGVPVATFQAVGHRLADCYIDLECLRLATYQAVSRLDAGVETATEVQIARVLAGDVGHRVSYATQHVHGGTGIDRDYPLWRYCLWLRSNELTLGSSASHLAALGAALADGTGLID